jgi:NAD-dependent SIR2 family protein deacetylase
MVKMNNLLKNAPHIAFKNRLSLTGKCACYHCLKVFESQEISVWTDKGETALCPYCQVDAVIPESPTYNLSKETLTKLNEYWFNKK